MRLEDDMTIDQEPNMADVDNQDTEMIDEPPSTDNTSCVLSITNVPVAVFEDDIIKVSELRLKKSKKKHVCMRAKLKLTVLMLKATRKANSVDI